MVTAPVRAESLCARGKVNESFVTEFEVQATAALLEVVNAPVRPAWGRDSLLTKRWQRKPVAERGDSN